MEGFDAVKETLLLASVGLIVCSCSGGAEDQQGPKMSIIGLLCKYK